VHRNTNILTPSSFDNLFHRGAVKHTVDRYLTYPQRINSNMQEETVLRSAQEIQDKDEHKRRLLLGILKERDIFFDLETKKIIDDKTSLETLLRILQNEKERERGIKHLEALNHVYKSPKMETQSYESIYDSWHIAYKLYTTWLVRFISNLCSWWT
jgi:hypothetical protein